MTRRGFFGRVGLGALLKAPASRGARGRERTVSWEGGEVGNSAFRLRLLPKEGLQKTRVTHLPSGLVLADADYSYSFERPNFLEALLSAAPDDATEVSLRGTALFGHLEIVHEFRLPAGRPWVDEQITLGNRGQAPLELGGVRTGFALPLRFADGSVAGEWADFKLTAIPYRREPNGNHHQYADFTLTQVLTQPFPSELWSQTTTLTPAYASEGWAWTNGRQGFLITKYSQRGMEWSLLDGLPLPEGGVGLRWGGLGIYRGNPERGAWLHPGETHVFGVTRLTAFSGGLLEGFYAFREEMAARGHGCPQGFDPPVHWNELYDNKLWWLPNEKQDDPEMRRKYYTLGDMKEEAAKAKAIGAEALYLDPGWDTSFGSKIWDESRLGPYRAFTTMLERDYGLKSSLHTPLCGWCSPTSYPTTMYRMDRFGRRLTWTKSMGAGASPLCGASRQYAEETARRLKALARDGAAYFMFDGTGYHGECWDPGHGHRVPSGREEHVQSLCRLARMIHADFPHALIEMHDPVVGGTTVRYTPTYYGHGPGLEQYAGVSGFDSVWAFELMWQPMQDLLSGRAIALYYYNLAYALPLYIHIDLRSDNANALVFWWNASTCRHLGIGGTPGDPAVRKAHQEAMAAYRRLERIYKAGTFYGLAETVHVHVDRNRTAAVVNCFNLDDRPIEKEAEFVPEKFGLDRARSYEAAGVPWRRTPHGLLLEFNVPARGHRLAEIRASQKTSG